MADRPSCSVLIPAYNEEATVADVVAVALAADLGPVLVVSDGSDDDTAERARAAGATVLDLPGNLGKGGAVVAGARYLATDVVVLLDADLVGLRPEHLHRLAAPVLAANVVMTRGIFTGGRWQTNASQRLAPQLNGQRAVVRRHLLDIPDLETSRYGIEVAITDHARREHWRWCDVDLPGVSQVMKEEKRGFVRGVRIRSRMYGEIVATLVRNLVRRS
ncbi:MAG: glycosyltransferase [Trueperaceae bacterium]|nr:glycosyltransferase [Trueperaceae bacterium]